MTTVTVENHRLRVTLPEEEFNRIGRYGVFHNAMKMLGNRSELAILIRSRIGREQVMEEARENLIHTHLVEHGRYNLNETLMRMREGRMMSPGMADDVARARAYADGVLSPISDEELCAWYLERYQKGEEPGRREFEVQIMRTGRHINENAKQVLAAAAESLERDMEFEIKHRQRFTNLCEGWTIEIIGEMPDQIGLCRYHQPKENPE